VLALAPAALSAQDDAYRARVTEAVAEFDAGRFEEARALFQQAHELSPNARTLRGIGMTSFELRDYPEAFRALSAALTDTRRPLDEAQITEVRSLLEQTRRFLGIYRLMRSPEGAIVEIDGQLAEPDDEGRVLLSVGIHSVTARAPGHRDRVIELRVRGNEDEELAIALEPAARSSSAQPAPAVSSADPIPGIALISVGAGAAVASIVTGASWWGTMESERTECDGTALCDNPDEVRASHEASIGTTIALAGAGAAAMVVGGVLLASGGGSQDQAFGCVPSIAGFACRGIF
jgi:tetratricopeptide (TPR) repeat protein